jgi:hypothetical protein
MEIIEKKMELCNERQSIHSISINTEIIRGNKKYFFTGTFKINYGVKCFIVSSDKNMREPVSPDLREEIKDFVEKSFHERYEEYSFPSI